MEKIELMEPNSTTQDSLQNTGLSSGPFSQEAPKLLQRHLEHLVVSIDLGVIGEREYLSALGKEVLREKGFSPAQQRAPGILIPLWGVEGTVVGSQLRPDRPRERDGKLAKHETPRGATNRLDIPPRCLQDLANPSVQGEKVCHLRIKAGAFQCIYKPPRCPFYGRFPRLEPNVFGQKRMC